MVGAARPPALATCFAAVAGMHALVHIMGLRRTLRLAARVTVDASSATAPDLVRQTAQRVATAAAFHPRRALCLEQSLALQLLLRRRGVPAELRLGAHPRPFYAHAWVEVNGSAISEQQDLPENLTVFATLGV